MKLYLNFERALTPAETDALREMIRRRGQREPLQHIVGSTSFCGLEIVVNRHVLVPRPETELLAESGWQFLQQLSEGRVPRAPNSTESENGAAQSSALRVLDFGTGTGCIAIALAVKCPAAKIIATDISADALALAKQNAVRHNVTGQIQFQQNDGFATLSGDVRFDLIISNPPYIPSSEIATLQPEVRDFDPRGALDGGTNGLDFYRLIAAHAAAFLKSDGKIMLEFGDGQADAVQTIFETEKWVVESVERDYSQQSRILIARR
jgi:release factor glutamine methyltransferase